jgi:hypothetical protein
MSGLAQPVDTSDTAARRYFELLRARSHAERATILAGRVSSVRQLATASVKLAHPDASEREVAARVAARIYGNDVAARFFPDMKF